MQSVIQNRRRRGGLLRAVLTIVALMCCLATAATSFAETTPGGTGRSPSVRPADVPSNSLPYTYIPSTPSIPSPTLTSVAPASGLFIGGYSAVLTGTFFTGATAVSFGGTPATSFTVDSATQITAVVPAGTGTVQVSVTTPGGTTNTVPFIYISIPVITSISPTSGNVAGGTAVVITGLNFTDVSIVNFTGIQATSFVVNSPTQITAISPPMFCITSVNLCEVQITVTNPAGPSNQATYTYVTEPIIASITPSSGPTAGGNTVTIDGYSFTGATTVTVDGTPATSFTVLSDFQISMVLPAHAAGAVNVIITGPGGTSSPYTYTYIAQPTVTNVSPPLGDPLGGDGVTINGTNFTGATAVAFGGTPSTSFVVNSATQISAVTPAHAIGVVDVAVTTPGGTGSLVNGYEFDNCGCIQGSTVLATSPIDSSDDAMGRLPLAPLDGESDTVYSVLEAPMAAPALSNLAPAFGPEAGGNTVIMTGSGLTGVTSVTFGSVPASSFTVNSDTQIIAVAPPGTGTVPVTVRNSESLAFSVASVAAAESNSGTSTLTFTVSLSTASGQPTTVQYSTGGGTATGGASCGVAGTDYQTASGTLTFNAGETSKTVPVTVCGDTTAEADETFNLTLSNPTGGATIATATATGTIGDDDTPQTVRVDDPTITYNPDGTATATFPVTTGPAGGTSSSTSARSGAQVGAQSFLTVTVNYSTANGTGTAGVEYVATSGTLTFGPGETGKTVDVTILPAGLSSGSSSFSLVLTGPSNATIPPGGGEAKAVVGDPAPVPAVAVTTDDDDKPRKETEEQRQQRQRTNRSNRDDEYTEGNVVEVHQDENPPYVVIANRDGTVKVLLQCGSQCPTMKVGQYVEADGVKEHEGLFYAESVTISKR